MKPEWGAEREARARVLIVRIAEAYPRIIRTQNDRAARLKNPFVLNFETPEDGVV